MSNELKQLYICAKAKKIGDGKCSGSGCAGGYCFMTQDKEYAKKYITIYEAQKLFESMVDRCILSGEQEKAKQYANALKSVQNAIIELNTKENALSPLYEQLSLFYEEVKEICKLTNN